MLVRHGESEWNQKNLFTGWKDVGLSANGVAEARAAGRKLKAQGLQFLSEADENTKGPASFMTVDPDGNPVLVDQHV